MKRAGLLAAALLGAGCGDNLPYIPDAGPPLGIDAGPCEVTIGEPVLALERVAEGMRKPVQLVSPPGDPRRFVIELDIGQIRLLSPDGTLLDDAFLDIDDDIGSGFEQGLLSLAFHPRHADNGRFYISWARDGDNALVVEEWRIDPDNPDRADPRTRRILLEVEHDTNFHYGAHLAFGPGGLLFVAVGDGGPQRDAAGRAQDLGSLRGKLLRIDVDRQQGELPYGIPADNPLVGVEGQRGEIWAYGLRNPWQFTIDPLTQNIFLGDVGFDSAEEINAIPAGAPGPLNFGWAVVEGATECQGPPGCATDGLTAPIHQYAHSEGCAIIGGPVYRGCAMPGHHGKLLFSDFCQGWVRSLVYSGGSTAFLTSHPGLSDGSTVGGFGVDSLGEVYLLRHDEGTIDKIVPSR